ncbi:hypothetical protein EVAR_57263_1 [Eumeta japonica]|uniref:Uncharacterized protein n=1 Tax=Eumeta variegata TaxID=151549 RepID=A0A4C1ZR77_EUMVA|nr:hypothetical protein EVAR_57263_1 [Eumeta japonica]
MIRYHVIVKPLGKDERWWTSDQSIVLYSEADSYRRTALSNFVPRKIFVLNIKGRSKRLRIYRQAIAFFHINIYNCDWPAYRSIIHRPRRRPRPAPAYRLGRPALAPVERRPTRSRFDKVPAYFRTPPELRPFATNHDFGSQCRTAAMIIL